MDRAPQGVVVRAACPRTRCIPNLSPVMLQEPALAGQADGGAGVEEGGGRTRGCCMLPRPRLVTGSSGEPLSRRFLLRAPQMVEVVVVVPMTERTAALDEAVAAREEVRIR